METPTQTGAKAPPRMKAEGGSSAQDGRTFKGKRGIRRLINAARYSCDGLLEAWRNEDAFRQEIVLTLILVPFAFWLPIALVEKILLIGVLVLVLIVELLNSAVEVAVDRDSFEINSLGKRAKDLGSAAVFLALLLAGGTWIAVLWTNFAPGAMH
ncbi:MAG TPA: diacylglycerol kinase [Burkholderiaceae bacterium]|nr:diacylglycerol kinase [Burkholderiaceae bacterium]